MKIEKGMTPLEYAKSLPVKELRKVIKDCKKGEYDEYTDRCRICFERFLSGDLEQAGWWSFHAELVRPEE